MKETPRVLILATTLPVRPGDGTPEFVLDLARSIEGMEREIVAPRVPDAPHTDELEAISIKRFPYFLRRWETLADGAILPNLRAHRPGQIIQVPFLCAAMALSALREARIFRPHVVHAHWIIPAGVVALFLRLALRIPYIVSVHGADAFSLRGRLASRLKYAVLKRASAVGFASAEAAKLFALPSRVEQRVAPMGVNVEAIGLGVGDRNPQRGRFLFVGRLAEKKGVDVLLAAAARVPEATIVVGGEGPEGPHLKALARDLGLSDRCFFEGRLSRADLYRELRLAQALVVPSKVARDGDQDTTPLVMSEAMSAGVPVIASRLGGLAEQIDDGKTGILVQPDSVSDLTEAMRRAQEHPKELEAFGLAAQEQIADGPLNIVTTALRYRSMLLLAATGKDRALDRNPGP